MAGRYFKRAQTVGDISVEKAAQILVEAHTTPEEVEEIYQLTSLAGFDERFVIPPFSREAAIELVQITQSHQEGGGMGFLHEPRRGL